jgi:hypothetical protein
VVQGLRVLGFCAAPDVVQGLRVLGFCAALDEAQYQNKDLGGKGERIAPHRIRVWQTGSGGLHPQGWGAGLRRGHVRATHWGWRPVSSRWPWLGLLLLLLLLLLLVDDGVR